MDWSPRHPDDPDSRFDGGDLDCGNGLLLLIRKHLDPLDRGQLLEILSTESSVEEDLPAWCRMTGNALVSAVRRGDQRSYMICKGAVTERHGRRSPPPPRPRGRAATAGGATMPEPAAAPPVAPLSATGVGSWPRPGWMVRAIHEHLEGRLGDAEFEEAGNDAVRLAVAAQLRAGADVVTDGEQRRDSYASFAGARLDGCQLIPITDLLPYVSDPRKFEQELRALDVPMEEVRQPVVLRPLRRTRPIVGHELAFARTLTDKPVKVALPGPYLLTRMLSLDCITEKAYPDRESLANDVVKVLREELFDLLAAGAAIVQFDEPVLTEVVFGRPIQDRVFMCGALSAKRDPDEELAFAGDLLDRVVAGAPRERLGLHVCRGNWSRDERVALAGDYTPLVPLFKTLQVGTFFLEMCTPRAGELAVLRQLPETCRVGVGVVNPKTAEVESVAGVYAKAEPAVTLLGPDRVLLHPDCGFATFADNPVASAQTAEAKLGVVAQVAAMLRKRHAVRAE
jgi:5-methyltetrahydropteroyltriglutamate--homocysteine methyltransferase